MGCLISPTRRKAQPTRQPPPSTSQHLLGREQRLGTHGAELRMGRGAQLAQLQFEGHPRETKGGTWGEGTAGGTAPHPLPGFLQVAAEDFPDFLLLVLGQGWDDAFLREGFGADVPAWTDSAQSHGATAHGRAEGLLAPRPLTGSTGRLGTHWMETAEMVEGILPKPPLSTSSIACFISIL